jgi:hypothetical protein
MAANYAKVGPENSTRWQTRGWCWGPGRRLGSGNRSLRLSTQRVTYTGGGGRRVTSHEHPPRVERQASPPAGAGRFVAGTKVAWMQNATALFMNVVE